MGDYFGKFGLIMDKEDSFRVGLNYTSVLMGDVLVVDFYLKMITDKEDSRTGLNHTSVLVENLSDKLYGNIMFFLWSWTHFPVHV